MSKFLENKQIIHIVSEVVIIAGVLFYISSSNKRLTEQINEFKTEGIYLTLKYNIFIGNSDYNNIIPVMGDIDNDGKLDVLANRVIYRNEGNDKFAQKYIWPVDMMPYYNGSLRTVWGDFDNDGYIDFVACWQSSTGGSMNTKIFHHIPKNKSILYFWLHGQ
jgi:hypothetical protein